jgi:hypothetical protein
LPYMGVVKVMNAVVLIKADQKFAISHRQVSRHGHRLAEFFSSWGWRKRILSILTCPCG